MNIFYKKPLDQNMYLCVIMYSQTHNIHLLYKLNFTLHQGYTSYKHILIHAHCIVHMMTRCSLYIFAAKRVFNVYCAFIMKNILERLNSILFVITDSGWTAVVRSLLGHGAHGVTVAGLGQLPHLGPLVPLWIILQHVAPSCRFSFGSLTSTSACDGELCSGFINTVPIEGK